MPGDLEGKTIALTLRTQTFFLEAQGGGLLKAVKEQADFREPLNSLSLEGGHWFIGK